MKIAVNTRFLLKEKMEGFGWFTYETVKRIVQDHPEHEFLFFFDRPFDNRFIFSSNVTPLVLSPPARHPILFKIWFNWSVTRALKKHKADLFFSPDGFLSLKTDVPQIGVIHDLNFEHYPEDLPASPRKYLRQYFPLFAKKARQLLTVSGYSKQDIVKTYGIPEAKITVAHNGGSELYHPLSANEQEKVKAELTGGTEYFIYVGALHARKNIERMIKAFDLFKQKSQSKTKLVIVGEKLWANQPVERTFEELASKNDILFTGHLAIEKLCNYVAASKALVLVSYFEGFGIPLVEAMRAQTAILCGNKTSLPEVAGDAAVLVDPFSEDSIKDGFLELDSNKTLRQQLIKNGIQRVDNFSWDKSAKIIWSVIEKELKQP